MTREVVTGLDALRGQALGPAYKGIPLGTETTIATLSSHGWNVAAGDLALPVLTLSDTATRANVATMAAYCRDRGVLLAPHGKTTMAPQLFDLQMRAGAWALTCATPTQLAVIRGFGLNRIILANELTDADALRWVSRQLDADPDFDFYCLVDSADVVHWMSGVLDSQGARRPVQVLLEMGMDGGRCGIRDEETGIEVARACRASRHLRLVGVEAYEGLVTHGDSPAEIDRVDTFLRRVRRLVDALSEKDLFEGAQVIVTAGGSSYFDRVVDVLRGGWSDVADQVTVVLRSGCYVSHDGGQYERLSPLAGRREPGQDLRLINALTGWAQVLSTPEPGLAVVGAGKRDFPYDVDLPKPRALHRGSAATDLREHCEVVKAMDQHLFLRLGARAPQVRAGDVVSFDLSHPCTAFDKFKLVYVVDDSYTVIDGILTFF